MGWLNTLIDEAKFAHDINYLGPAYVQAELAAKQLESEGKTEEAKEIRATMLDSTVDAAMMAGLGKGLYGAGKSLFRKLLAPIIRLGAGMTGGIGGMYAGDKLVHTLSDGKYDTWGEMVLNKTKGTIGSTLAHLSNPLAILGGFAGGWGANKAYTGTKRGKMDVLSGVLDGLIENTKLGPSFIDQAAFLGKLGWAPKQTIPYRHGSLDPKLKTFVPKHDRWDVVTHGADPNMYFVTDQSTPVSAANMMDLRPYQYTGSIVAEKPMVQVGDFNIAGKNATRNQLIARARQQGADTYLLQDIVDNKVPHLNVVARFIGPEGEAVQGGTLLQAKSTPTKTSLAFFERNPANITHAEKLGLTKHDRYGLGSFKSDLDWTAHKWMKDNIGGYNILDVMALQSHVPEYLKLELKFKGTTNWLKMRNGKTYIDDPRGWIQLLSKNGRIFDDSPIYTGVKTGVVDPNYNGIFWGTYDNGWISLYLARAYAPNDVSTLELVVPNNVKTYTQTHDGNTSWFALGGKEKPLLTNDVVETHFNNGIDRVNIRGIIDMGPNTGNIHSSKYNKLFDYTTHQGIIDEKFNAKFPQNDVIINLYVPRKSIIGNNGNFNLDDSNIYRKQGGSIHIKKKNRGKFTASAKAAGHGVQEHAHKVMNDPNATPLQKKRANFAIQAKKWHHKHQLGGKINYLDIFV